MNKYLTIAAVAVTVSCGLALWWSDGRSLPCCEPGAAVLEEDTPATDAQVLAEPEKAVLASSPGAAVAGGENSQSMPEGSSPRANAQGTAVPLDLSLPSDVVADGGDPLPKSPSRYGVEGWFDAKPKGEERLKIKSKIHLKDDVSVESGLNNYDESIEGAEMGFEYKTR